MRTCAAFLGKSRATPVLPLMKRTFAAAELHSEAFCSFKVLSRDSSLALINTRDNMSPNLNAKILILCLFTFSLSIVLA